MGSILNIKRGLFDDVKVKYKDPISEWFYITPKDTPKPVFDELVNAWTRYNECVKDLEDEIFKEEEFLWKESRSLAEEDAKKDTAYLLGLKEALRIVKEGA
jgi:hypothetical protein